jgi:hypothetical protein
MRRAALVVGCILGACLATSARGLQVVPATVQQDRPWWVTCEFGEGQLKLSSDQQQGNRTATFAMGFAGGRRLGDWARVGLHLNGWLLQGFDLQNPAVGESVSNVGGVFGFFPSRKSRLFARGGVGWSEYTNNRPSGTNGNGLGWEVGGGYEIPLRGQLGLAPMVEYAAGGLGDAYDPTAPQTGRRYSVVEFKVEAVYHFGSRKR